MKILFGPFTLDLDTRQLTRGRREIHLAPKAFELLATLVLDRPKVLSKAVLQQRPSDRPSCWLEWGNRRFPLSLGEHVVGRDPHVEVRLDASTVSRRHARLVVTAEGRAVLEDFGSKNGTFRRSKRVTSPVQLADGDSIRIGSLLVTFHVSASLGSRDTQVESTG